MTETKLAFWTTGEGMTGILRDLWEERSCIHAFRTAKEGLGMTDEQALELFEGRMKLEGDTRNDPDLYSTEDNHKGTAATSMIDWFEDRYIDIRVDKLKYDLSLRNNMIKYLHLGQGEFIGDTQREAKNAALYMEKKTFEYLRNLMFLYNITDGSITNFEIKVNEALRDAELDREQSYIKDELDASNTKVLFDESIKAINEALPGAPTTVDEYIENEARIDGLQALKGEAKDSPSGWLSPEGDYYPCPYMGHSVLALELAEEGIVQGVTDEKDLEKQGWAKVCSLRIYNADDRFTNKQKDFIFDFIEAHKLVKIQINAESLELDHLFEYFEENEGHI